MYNYTVTGTQISRNRMPQNSTPGRDYFGATETEFGHMTSAFQPIMLTC